MHVRVELSGHGYECEIGNSVRAALTEAPNRTVRGEWVPAFSPYLITEFFINVMQQIPVDSVVALLFYVTKKTFDAIHAVIKEKNSQAPLFSTLQISMPEYDIAIYHNPENSDLGIKCLLKGIQKLVEDEAKNKRRVLRVSCPVSFSKEEYYCGRQQNNPNFWLWAVEYEEGGIWEPRVYDNANGCFLEKVTPRIDSRSKY